jgi:hypothetical protein
MKDAPLVTVNPRKYCIQATQCEPEDHQRIFADADLKLARSNEMPPDEYATPSYHLRAAFVDYDSAGTCVAHGAARTFAVLFQIRRLGAVGDGFVLAHCRVSTETWQRYTSNRCCSHRDRTGIQQIVAYVNHGCVQNDACWTNLVGTVLFAQEHCRLLVGDWVDGTAG